MIDLGVAYLSIGFVVFAVMLFVVPQDRTPSSAVAWLLLIALLPVVGLLIYLLIGRTKLPEKRLKRQRAMDARVRERIEEARAGPNADKVLAPALSERHLAIADLAEHLGGMPVFGRNHVRILGDYDATLAEIARAIAGARVFVHLEYFILSLDAATEPIFVELEAAVKRGVKVRVMFDHIGSRSHDRHAEMLARMSAAGITWQRSLPVLPFDGKWARPDLRNHRKIVVVDGLVGFTGSQNIIQSDYHEPPLRFYEAVARVSGPIARQLDAVFIADWASEEGEVLMDGRPTLDEPDLTGPAACQIIPSGPSQRDSNNLRVFLSLLYAARRRVILVNPYFVPDDALLMALTSAAQRGVHVHLITHEVGDSRFLSYAQRSYYDELLRVGVKLSLYPHPAVLHSKLMLIDDDITLLGSSNLDTRSLHLNHEISLLCFDRDVADELAALAERYADDSRALDADTWKRRSKLRRAAENLARLTAALL